MSIDVREDKMQHAELFGKPVLYTNWLIARETVPKGWYCYDIRGTDRDPNKKVSLEDHVSVNHAGSVLSPVPLKKDETKARQIRGQFFLHGEEMDLETFCGEHDLEYPADTRKYILRPASKEEAGLFYSQMEPEQDAAECTVGHLRMDFGGGGFHHSWWPHNDDRFNTPEFKAVLQELVDELRASGPLKDQSAMSKWCHQHADSKIQDGHYGFIVETADHRFCLRCTTMRGDYSYLYCDDLTQQRQAMDTQQPPSGPEQGMTMGGILL